MLHHPVVYAARGLAALLRRESTWVTAQEALLRLAASPFEQVVFEALGASLSVWDVRPEVAWVALNLAVDLSIVEPPLCDVDQAEREQQHRRRIDTAIKGALEHSKAQQLAKPPPLPKMPSAWVPTAGKRRMRRGRRSMEMEAEWEHPSTAVQGHFLSKVLERIPVRDAMADNIRRELFLSWCDGLVEWTIEWLSPSWARHQGADAIGSTRTELLEWRQALYSFLATVSLHLEASESLRRFVEPVEETADEIACSLFGPYAALLACNIMDEPTFPPKPLALLESIVPRLLSHEGWKRGSWDAGAPRDQELSRLIRVMFFVEVENAQGAARFANGDWRDVPVIFPLVEPFLRAYGENWTVASDFVTMCERAFKSYPIEDFVAQLPMVIGRSKGTPLGWRGTSLPARLAALIQRFAERSQPLPPATALALLRALDALVDMGDRRSAAVQTSEVFKDVRTLASA